LKKRVSDQLLAHYFRLQSNPQDAPSCFIGFDGFTDEIAFAVKTRYTPTTYHFFSTIEDFGQKIVGAAGKSCNIELVVKEKKIGGNAPIMTEALLRGGHAITFAGMIGTLNAIEPLFQEMASQCRHLFPLGSSAHSDAIEFDDGKIILGKLDAIKHFDYDLLLKLIGKKVLTDHLDAADLFACVNWTMLPAMTDLWNQFADEIIPFFQRRKKRILFVDLADPAKRTDEDLVEAMRSLIKLAPAYKIILGLNAAEALRLLTVFQESTEREGKEGCQRMAQDLQKRIGCHEVVIHATAYAVVASEDAICAVDGPYCDNPLLTTGGGDNFNAGYCNGCLYGFSPEESLLSGVATSGYYVRNGKSPTMAQLADFITQWNQ
jgi:hypothetical protein